MLRFAFSTVACPTWTLDRVASFARECGFTGVELRTLGHGSSQLACDPALTAGEKVRSIFASEGVAVAGVGTSCRFDEPITPPVLGRLKDTERPVREAERALDIARQAGAGWARVFPFEPAPNEKPLRALVRIVERLRYVADHARWGSLRIAVENSGGFPRAADALEIVDAVGHPLVGGCWCSLTGVMAGDAPDEGLRLLAGDLIAVRLKDVDAAGRPCLPGDGVGRCEEVVRALDDAGYSGWVVYEWDAAWLEGLAPAEEVLPAALERLLGWVAPEPAALQAGEAVSAA